MLLARTRTWSSDTTHSFIQQMLIELLLYIREPDQPSRSSQSSQLTSVGCGKGYGRRSEGQVLTQLEEGGGVSAASAGPVGVILG